MLSESKLKDKDIEKRVRLNIMKMKQTLADQLDIDLIKSKDDLDGINKENIPLDIDFTELASIAMKKGLNSTSKFLIEQEKSIAKKIPFMVLNN